MYKDREGKRKEKDKLRERQKERAVNESNSQGIEQRHLIY